jgi:serine protease Do
MAKAFGLTQARGVAVTDVAPDSPAMRAGVQVGDVLVAVNGTEVSDANALRNRITSTPPGSSVHLKVMRNGQEREVTAKLEELRSEGRVDRPGAPGSQNAEGALAGVDVEPVTPELARRLGIPANVRGLLVSDVDPGSGASAAGLRRGDVIREVNRKPVNSVSDLANAVRQSSGQTILLLVQRGSGTRFIAIEP